MTSGNSTSHVIIGLNSLELVCTDLFGHKASKIAVIKEKEDV